MKPTIPFRFAATAVAAALGLATGCGSSLDSSVSGTVTLDGKPLAVGDGSGTVSFYPAQGGPAAQATIAPDGTYVLKTGHASGIRSGDYVVTVVATGPSPKPLPGAPPRPGPLLTPIRYGTRQGSKLRFMVGPGANQIDIAMTSR
ncbi:MAG: hypothetical protein JW809_01045 [Pirellulales bacterium]|nr:hypothetical protein [Pirellulales bacterium]